MNESYEQYQTIDDVDVIDEGIANAGGIPPYGQTVSPLPWSKGRIAAKMEIATELSNSRAWLARQSMQNLAILSKEEGMLSQIDVVNLFCNISKELLRRRVPFLKRG